MKFSRITKLFFASQLILLSVSARAQGSSSSDQGATVSLSAGVDITTYSDAGLEGGIGFAGGLKGHYYIHKHIGFYGGLDFAFRQLSDEMIPWMEFPFGITFRYSIYPEIRNYLNLGLYYGMPLKDHSGAPLQGGLGFGMEVGTLFPISPEFHFGLVAGFKLGFASVVEGASTGKLFTLNVGLLGTYIF